MLENNNLAAKIYSSGNDLLVTRADDDSGIKYRLISSKSGLKLNKYVNDVGSTLWEAATNVDFVGEYTASIMLSSNQSNGYSISTMIPLPGADAYTITPVSLRLLDGSSQVTSGIEIDRKNKAGFSVSYYGTAFQGVGAYLVFRASK